MGTNKTILIVVLVLIIGGGLIYYFGFSKKETSEEQKQQLANPASVFCQENGGTSKIITFENGQDGLCTFDDNSICWEWDFYRNDCKKGELKVEVLQEGTGKLAKKGDTAVVHYTGKFEDGTVFDTTQGRDPFEFKIGAQQVLPVFESQIVGMAVGDKKKIKIKAEDGYGPVNAMLIKEVPKQLLNTNGVEPKEGMKLKVEPKENPQLARIATITKVTDTSVTIDLNHPLAGKNLTFEVNVVALS